MRRRDFLGLTVSVTAAWPLTARAQQQGKTRRIGYLDYGAGILPNGEFAPFYNVYRRKQFLDGLRDRGWVEGQNVTVERRFAAGQADRLPALAAELVQRQVDVLAAPGGMPLATAAKDATSTIPVVFMIGSDRRDCCSFDRNRNDGVGPTRSLISNARGARVRRQDRRSFTLLKVSAPSRSVWRNVCINGSIRCAAIPRIRVPAGPVSPIRTLSLLIPCW